MTVETVEEKLQRADDLRADLERGSIIRSDLFDMLSRYRLWLDKKLIPAETGDGWPTEEAYDSKNIKAFLAEWNGLIDDVVGTIPAEEVPFAKLKRGIR